MRGTRRAAASLVSTIESLESRWLLTADFGFAFKVGGTGDDRGNAVASDSAGNSYVVGNFSGTVDFDPGAATKNLISSGAVDAFVAKYSSGGALVWAQKIGGIAALEQGTAVAVDASGNVLVAGIFAGTVDFNAGAGTANLTAGG